MRRPQAAKAEAAVSQAVPIFGPEEIADMETLLEKVRLQLVFAESG